MIDHQSLHLSFDIVMRQGHELTRSDVDVYGFAANPNGEKLATGTLERLRMENRVALEINPSYGCACFMRQDEVRRDSSARWPCSPRQEPPLAARSRHVPNGVENRSQLMLALRAVFAAKQQIRQHKRPLLVRHIARITTTSLLGHPSMLDRSPRPAKNLTRYKVPNRL